MSKDLKKLEEYISDLTRCIVDDKTPFPLRPLKSVWVRKFYPLTIEKPFKEFARVESYPKHPKIYYDMWQGLNSVEKMTKESFMKLFLLVYHLLFSNATDERSNAAAETIWYDSIAASGVMRMEEFICATQQIMLKYGNSQDPVIFFTELVELAKKQSPDSWVNARLEPSENARLLDNPRSYFVHDLLDSEEYEKLHFKSTTANRIIVTGGEGMGKSFLSAKIAEKLNCVNLDVEKLAVEAAEDPFDINGSEIKRLVSEQQPIPLHIQAALIKHELNKESTQHRGYVFGDIPMLNKDVESMFLSETGITDFIPQAVVNIIGPPDLVKTRAAMSREQNDQKYQELQRDNKVEIEITKIIEIEEKDVRDEPKILEQKEDVDEEDDLDQKEIEAEKTRINEAIRKRRFLAELHQQIISGRREVFKTPTDATINPLDGSVLAN
eukprot:Tbor_TRINITY_DN1181_c0_g2::TRINITY_DN1181_c0_g2_i1::g.15549::m.15549